MKLISMTEKVLQLSKDLGIGGDTFHDFYLKTTYYANFLSQHLTLGMFVPCDDNGNVLEEPEKYGWLQNLGGMNINASEQDVMDCDKYHTAKEKVLFEGFEIEDSDSGEFSKSISICSGIFSVFWYKRLPKTWQLSYGIETIEDLVKYNLTLTESAKQQFKQ